MQDNGFICQFIWWWVLSIKRFFGESHQCLASHFFRARWVMNPTAPLNLFISNLILCSVRELSAFKSRGRHSGREGAQGGALAPVSENECRAPCPCAHGGQYTDYVTWAREKYWGE